jgi:hypothetical protein
VDGFIAAKEVQERVAAGEAVERELLEDLALAVIAAAREGRIALALLRSVSDEECLSWALDLSEAVLAADHPLHWPSEGENLRTGNSPGTARTSSATASRSSTTNK